MNTPPVATFEFEPTILQHVVPCIADAERRPEGQVEWQARYWRVHQVVSTANSCDESQGLTSSAPRDAKGVEVEQPGEAEKIQEVSDQFNRFQMMNFNEHMHCLRGTHLKTQGVREHHFLRSNHGRC